MWHNRIIYLFSYTHTRMHARTHTHTEYVKSAKCVKAHKSAKCVKAQLSHTAMVCNETVPAPSHGHFDAVTRNKLFSIREGIYGVVPISTYLVKKHFSLTHI